MNHEIRVLDRLGAEFERVAAAPQRRRWSPSWRSRPLVVVLVLVVAGSAAAAATLVTGKPSARPSATLPVPAGSKPNGADIRRYDVALTPNLNGGAVGWCLSAELNYTRGGQSGGGGCGAPLKQRPIITFAAGQSYVSAAISGRLVGRAGTRTTTIAAVTTPQVAAVRISPALTILTRADRALPNGYRIAVAIHETATANGGRSIDTVRVSPPFTWVALARNGRVIPTSLRRPSRAHPQQPLSPQDNAAYWQTQPTRGVGPQPKLHKPPTGACEIYSDKVAGATPSFGEVVQHVHGFAALVARAYLSCAFTYLSYRGYGMQTAILLDAQHPGSRPEQLPDATVVGHNPTIVNEPAGLGNGGPQYITARRVGNAWLLVESTSPLATRTTLLRALRACVNLTSTACSAHG